MTSAGPRAVPCAWIRWRVGEHTDARCGDGRRSPRGVGDGRGSFSLAASIHDALIGCWRPARPDEFRPGRADARPYGCRGSGTAVSTV